MGYFIFLIMKQLMDSLVDDTNHTDIKNAY